MPFSRHLVICQIFVVGRDLVDQLAPRYDLHDPVGCCLDDLMVPGGEQKHTREFDHPVIQRCDRLHIQMIGGLVEEQHIGTGDHHLGQQAPHLFSSGKYLQPFHAVFSAEQHPA